MNGSIGGQGDTSFSLCLKPRAWYEPGDPCASGEWIRNGPLDRAEAALSEVPAAASRAVDTAKPWFYGGLALLVFWLGLRAYEAYKR